MQVNTKTAEKLSVIYSMLSIVLYYTILTLTVELCIVKSEPIGTGTYDHELFDN